MKRTLRPWSHLLVMALFAAAIQAKGGQIGSEPFDYSQPRLLKGLVYAMGADRAKPLFTFERLATRSNSTTRVERRFSRPDGALAAQQIILYEAGRLVSYEMKEFQAGLLGSLRISEDPGKPGRELALLNFGRDGEATKKPAREELPQDTLIDDTLYPFVLAHWAELTRGERVKFRFVSLEHEKTFGFKLLKASEGALHGQAVVRIKMEPTNIVVARIIDPIYLTIQKDEPHRVLEYSGRTVPRVKSGRTWKYLDAVTVFESP